MVFGQRPSCQYSFNVLILLVFVQDDVTGMGTIRLEAMYQTRKKVIKFSRDLVIHRIGVVRL